MRKIANLMLALALTLSAPSLWANGHHYPSDDSTDTATSTLTATETADLLYLREEEKLARDTYLYLYGKWHLGIFANIAASEEKHMGAVKDLLDTYQLADPALPVIGAFSNPALQAAYDQLIQRGSTSVIEALMVGGYIEELDIKDLEIKLDETDKPDIQTVYSHLERGSRDHLRSFVGQIESRDLVYTAQILDQETVDSIVGSAIETGP